jgi:hypothetical protein
MAENTTNIRYILDRLMLHPLLQDITLEQVVDLTVSFMKIVGVPQIFSEKVATLEVLNYRAILPTDYVNMTQVRSMYCGCTFRSSTDSFHMSDTKVGTVDLTYKIQGGIIYTSIPEDTIEIAYKAIELDCNGYPVIPDNSSFTRALELYIKKYWFTILFDLGKINPDSLQNVQQEYAWAVGDCESEFNRLSLDEAESFFNSWRTLLIRPSEHSQAFRNNGIAERIKLQ